MEASAVELSVPVLKLIISLLLQKIIMQQNVKTKFYSHWLSNCTVEPQLSEPHLSETSIVRTLEVSSEHLQSSRRMVVRRVSRFSLCAGYYYRETSGETSGYSGIVLCPLPDFGQSIFIGMYACAHMQREEISCQLVLLTAAAVAVTVQLGAQRHLMH